MSLLDEVNIGWGVDGLGVGLKMGLRCMVEGGVVNVEGGVSKGFGAK